MGSTGVAKGDLVMLVAIEAGHGGDWTGTEALLRDVDHHDNDRRKALERQLRHQRGCMVGKMPECDYTIGIARHLASIMRHIGDPGTPLLVRERNDQSLGLGERGSIANGAGADLAIIIHVDSGAPHQRGSGAYYRPGDYIGRAMAEAFLRSVPEPLHIPSRKPHKADPTNPQDLWLKPARNCLNPYDMPAVLVELGFGSNPGDLKALENPTVQLGLVIALMVAICEGRRLVWGGQ